MSNRAESVYHLCQGPAENRQPGPAPEHDKCMSDNNCNSGMWCREGQCSPYAKVGEHCGGQPGPNPGVVSQCAPDLKCFMPLVGSGGRCIPK